MKALRFIIGLALSLTLHAAISHAYGQKAELRTLYKSPELMNGVITDSSGTLYVVYPRIEGGSGIRLGRIRLGGSVEPYPDAAWNSLHGETDPKTTFVRLNAFRFGPDGLLWVVDVGAPTFNSPVKPGGVKLVVIDTKSDKVVRVYHLDSATYCKSYIDDIRFHGPIGYITDAGSPGLIVLDLKSGSAHRVLDNQKSTTDSRPMMAEGRVMRKPDGSDLLIHADQQEVSPNGKYLYFQPCSGPLNRIETRYLDDPGFPKDQLSAHISIFANTPTTGGTAIDADGNIYSSDTDKRRVLKIDPQGHISTLISDPRLVWVDAMWIDDKGNLIMPAAQMERIAPFHGGTSGVQPPFITYMLPIGAQPIR